MRDVLDYARINPYPAIPSERKHEHVYNGYMDVFKSLLEQVPEIPGWYAWIKSKENKNKLELIYLGKSSKRKTSDIRARLDEEFRDERIAIWATVDEHLRNSEPKGKYAREAKRSLKKVDVTHIIWVGQKDLSDEQVKAIECNLIKRFNPPANIQKGGCSDSHQELTKKVMEVFEQTMAEIRIS